MGRSGRLVMTCDTGEKSRGYLRTINAAKVLAKMSPIRKALSKKKNMRSIVFLPNLSDKYPASIQLGSIPR